MSKYELIDTDPTPEEYLDLREATGMSSRTIEGVERGLENTLHGVTVRADTKAIGMGRIIGDRRTTYHLVDNSQQRLSIERLAEIQPNLSA